MNQKYPAESTPSRLPPLLAAVLLALLAACHGQGPVVADAPATGLPPSGLPALQGTWLLVPEASRADTLTYRPNTYRFKFRPEGRPGFQLGPNGRFTRYDVASGGGLLAQEGTWTETTTGRLLIHLPHLLPAQPDYELAPIDYQKGVLRLRRLAERPAVEVMRETK